jgi:hypothetical protein
VVEGVEIASFFGNRGFQRFVSGYLTKSLPWYR